MELTTLLDIVVQFLKESAFTSAILCLLVSFLFCQVIKFKDIFLSALFGCFFGVIFLVSFLFFDDSHAASINPTIYVFIKTLLLGIMALYIFNISVRSNKSDNQ